MLTAMLMEPPCPPLAMPLAMRMGPLLPVSVVPVLSVRVPDRPLTLALAVRTTNVAAGALQANA